MGTNYYIKCKFCESELKHIGKHSNDEFLSNLTLMEFIKIDFGHWELLTDEGKNAITVKEFLKRIPEKWVLVKGEFC